MVGKHHLNKHLVSVFFTDYIGTYLDQFVPSSAHNDRVLGIRAEADTGYPLGVTLVGDGELAVAQRVPQLDCTVS